MEESVNTFSSQLQDEIDKKKMQTANKLYAISLDEILANDAMKNFNFGASQNIPECLLNYNVNDF